MHRQTIKRRWKIIFSGKESNVKNYYQSQKGFTLVEILAAVVIASIVSILVFNVINKSYSQYNNQMNENYQLSDISFAFKIITKEIRKTESSHIKVINNGIQFNNSGTYFQLDEKSNTIFKYNITNNQTEKIATKIKIFEVKQTTINEWRIKIVPTNTKLQRESIETTIISRER